MFFNTQNSTKNVWALWRFRHQEILQFLKASISINITAKEITLSAFITFYKVFNCLESILSNMIPYLRKVLMKQYLTMTSAKIALYMMVVLLMIGSDLSTYTCMASLLRTAFSWTPLMSSTARPTWRREEKWLSLSKKILQREASKGSLRSNKDAVLLVCTTLKCAVSVIS